MRKFFAALSALVLCVLPAEAAMNVNINAVVQHFLDNPIRAGQIFMNKEVITEGEVIDIKGDGNGSFFITIKSPGNTEFRYANFFFQCWLSDESLNKAAALNKGSRVLLRGTVFKFHQRERGIFIEGNIVSLGGCVLMSEQEREIYSLLERAKGGDPQAQFLAGVRYERGEGVPRDLEEAVRWYREGANRGSVGAMIKLGVFYAEGVGVPKNYPEAMRLFRQAADKGSLDGMVYLARMYENIPEPDKNIPESVKLYARAAMAGSSEALRRLQRFAENGNTDAQRFIGDIFYNGTGTPKNFTEARKFYSMAAEKNDPASLYMLGLINSKGLAAPDSIPNPDEALKFYTLAAQHGHPEAAFTLYKLHMNSNNLQEAVKYLKLSAERGHPEAVKTLGRYSMTFKKWGLNPDFVLGVIASKRQDSGKIFTVIGRNVKLRSTPDTASPVSARLNAGDSVIVLESSDSWLKVKTSADISGWVLGKYLTHN